MPKPLRDIIKETPYEPVPDDEKRFKAKHGYDEKTGRWPMFQNMYSAEAYDKLFRGTSVKTIERAKERHGYNVGDDVAHYESFEDKE